ncbi:uncharacterized protein LOC130810182 [Amaranthus tricolor]|uniref:uncharacterized protein LOC130810182 n=1 Tax=Amaranthus tricolor TaxID=29722 RepID=UPI00258411A6|nr:uncharacterized protein LOC130810182 [Amaranthus tricolor]
MAGFWASVFLCRPKPRALAGSTMVVAMGTRGREPFREGNLILERSNGEIDGDVTHRTQAGWLKWRAATGVLCDKKFLNRLKGKTFRVAIRPSLLYGKECWFVKKVFEQRMDVTELRMLRWMCGHTMIDRIRNQDFRESLGVAPLSTKMRENILRWFRHVQRKTYDAPVRRIESIILEGKRSRGRPRKTWKERIKSDLHDLHLSQDLTRDRVSS